VGTIEIVSEPFNNWPEMVPIASQWLANCCLELGLGREDAFRLDLCLNEALQNVTQYSGASWFQIGLVVDNWQAVLSIHDNGMVFDPLAVKEPMPTTDLQAAPVGGWGVHLLHAFSDRLNYARLGDVNILRMAFRLMRAE
jgi:serine/threonine-protein kinase RsbW